MAISLDDLTAKVAAEHGAVQSVLALVTGLAAAVRANANDPAKLQALADQIDADSAALAGAVAANPVP